MSAFDMPRGDVEALDLTIRERFAAMAMQGLLAGPHRDAHDDLYWMAEVACRCADRLLAELAKEPT